MFSYWLSKELQVLSLLLNKSKDDKTNPVFKKFQRIYLVGYLPAVYADWLQIPYLYRIYDSYGFLESQIAVLYIFGLASSLVAGCCANTLTQRHGRKPLCLLFLFLYSVSAGLKTSSSYSTLLISEVLRGSATSILFSVMEAWYVHEHIQSHDFPKEWISLSFEKASLWNGLLAVAAGLFSFIPGSYFPQGATWPYGISIPCFMFSGFMIATKWSDNKASGQVDFIKSLRAGMHSICAQPRILLLGVVQAVFESVVVVFAFLWTPMLSQLKNSTSPNPPLGLIFANFMLCSFGGGIVFRRLTKSCRLPFKPQHALIMSVGIVLAAFVLLLVAQQVNSQLLCLMAFLALEFAAGLYFPAMSKLRKEELPQAHVVSIGNLMRAPLYLLACTALVWLHQDTSRRGNAVILLISVGLLSSALLSAILLAILVKRTDNGDGTDQSQQFFLTPEEIDASSSYDCVERR